MATEAEPRARIYYEVDPALRKEFQSLFPWGTRARMMSALTKRLCELAKRSPTVQGMLLSGKFTIDIVLEEEDR